MKPNGRTGFAAFSAALALGLFAVSGVPCHARQTGSAPPAQAVGARQSVQGVLDAWLERSGAPGATAGAVRADGSTVHVAAGLSRKPDTAMKPGDRMFSGSIGKTHCAAVMLLLVQEGKAALDDKASRWLGKEPWLGRLPNAGSITLRQLMNHTSGIMEHVQSAEFIAALKAAPEKTWKPEELLAFVFDKEPLFAPGEGWSYADTNYVVVGMIVEKITGRTYYNELERRILVPLKLVDTIPSDRARLPGLISGYCGPNNPFTDKHEVAVDGVYHCNPQFEWTGGGLVSTAFDLAIWAKAIYGGDVLNESTRAEMLKGVKAKTGPNDEYGLGVILWPTRHGRAIGHSGWFPGYVSIMAYYPDLKIAVALQINTDEPAKLRGMRAFLDDAAEAIKAAN